MKAELNVQSHSPISIDPSNADALASEFIIGRDASGQPVHHAAFTNVRAAMQTLFDTSTALDSAMRDIKAAGVNDPATTDRLRRAAVGKMNSARKAVAEALTAAHQHVEAVNVEIDTHLGIPTARVDVLEAGRCSDVRAYLRSLPQRDRTEAVRKAIADGDKAVVAAILSASPYASGLTRKEAEFARADAERAFTGESVRMRASIGRLVTLLETAASSAERRHAGLTGGGDSPVARAERAISALEEGSAA